MEDYAQKMSHKKQCMKRARDRRDTMVSSKTCCENLSLSAAIHLLSIIFFPLSFSSVNSPFFRATGLRVWFVGVEFMASAMSLFSLVPAVEVTVG